MDFHLNKRHSSCSCRSRAAVLLNLEERGEFSRGLVKDFKSQGRDPQGWEMEVKCFFVLQ